MSSGLVLAIATAGLVLAVIAIAIGARSLKQAKTVDVFEAQPQPYMLQAEPPSPKVQALSLPRRDLDTPQEKQA